MAWERNIRFDWYTFTDFTAEFCVCVLSLENKRVSFIY